MYHLNFKIFVLLLSLGVGSVLWAAPQEAATFAGDSVDVELVNVEVRVTDRKGQPITGLEAKRFQRRGGGAGGEGRDGRTGPDGLDVHVILPDWRRKRSLRRE